MGIQWPNHPLFEPALRRRYREAAIVAGLALCGLLAMLWFAYEAEEARAQTLMQGQSAIQAAHDSQNKAQLEREIYQSYHRRYLRLLASRTLADEDRLKLIEAMKGYQALQDYAGITFQVEPQQLALWSVPEPMQAVALKASQVKLSFRVQDSRYMLSLIAGLGRLPGVLLPRQCQWGAMASANDGRGVATTVVSGVSVLEVECMLEWLTFSRVPPTSSAPSNPPPTPTP